MNSNVKLESLVRLAVREDCMSYLDSIPSEKELEKILNPSPKFIDAINKILAKATRSETVAQFKRIASKVAVIVLICFSLSFSTLLTAKAVRESIVTTVLEWHDKFTKIFVTSDAPPQDLPEIRLNYIPEGFELVEEESCSFPDVKIFVYKNSYQQFVRVVIELSTTLPTDYANNENSSYIMLTLNNKNCIWINHSNENKLIIPFHSYILNITSSSNLEEIIEIYKNIEFF